MKKTYKILLMAILAGLLTNTGRAQLNCYTLVAPEKVLEGTQKIAIMNFQDRDDVNWQYWSSRTDYGSQLADYMISALLEEERGVNSLGVNYMERVKTNVYTVIERGQLDNILKEQQLGASGAISEADAAEIGKLLGLDIILNGSFSTAVETKSSTSSSKDKEGKVTYYYSAKKVATIEATMKIVSVETGEILSMVTKTVTPKSSTTGKNTSDALNKLMSDKALISQGLKQMAYQLVAYFAPTFMYQALDFEKPKVKEYKDEAKEAKKAIKSHNLNQAYSIVKAVYDADPYDAQMAHNMGILNEAVGNYEKAIEYHTNALELDDSKAHVKSLKRATNGLEAIKILNQLGASVQPYIWDAPAGAKSSAETITTKGKKGDRINVYADANKGTDVVAKVPGKTEFVVLGKEGSFIKIKLLGGKEGFISASDVAK